MSSYEINESDWTKEVLCSDKPVVVDFYAPWCAPCKGLAGTLELLDTKYAERIKFVKINVEQNRGLSKAYNVRTLPSILFLRAGQIKTHLTGNLPQSFLENRIEELLNL